MYTCWIEKTTTKFTIIFPISDTLIIALFGRSLIFDTLVLSERDTRPFKVYKWCHVYSTYFTMSRVHTSQQQWLLYTSTLFLCLQEELKQRSHLLFGSTGVQASLPLEYINTHKELRASLLNLDSCNTSPFETLRDLTSAIERFKILPPVYKYMVRHISHYILC